MTDVPFDAQGAKRVKLVADGEGVPPQGSTQSVTITLVDPDGKEGGMCGGTYASGGTCTTHHATRSTDRTAWALRLDASGPTGVHVRVTVA